MNYLCICTHGLVRSEALADVIGSIAETRVKALISGPLLVSADDLTWADKIISLADPIFHEEFMVSLTPEIATKVIRWDIGPDRWGDKAHPELIAILKKKWTGHRLGARRGRTNQ